MLAGCGKTADRPADSRDDATRSQPVVYVVNYPLKYFADRIGGGQIEVVFPVPADEDPAYWQPDDEAIGGYQQADLILVNGATYAKWTAHVSLPPSRMVNTSQSFASEYIELEDQVVHRHGPEGEHAHEGYAFTTWLDPRLAIQQAEAVHRALSTKWPEQSADFTTGWQSLKKDLESLDADLTTANAAYEGQPLLASHPVYQYLARRCKWNLQSVHWEPGEMPDEEQWQQLQQLLEKHPAARMIWEAEPLEEVRQRLATLGVQCMVFSPCGNVPESGDYLQVMRENIERVRSILAPSGAQSPENGAAPAGASPGET